MYQQRYAFPTFLRVLRRAIIPELKKTQKTNTFPLLFCARTYGWELLGSTSVREDCLAQGGTLEAISHKKHENTTLFNTFIEKS